MCVVNSSSLMVLGGWSQDSALSSVEILNLETGTWSQGPPMERPRYGHACLYTELGGREGVLVTGGALSGRAGHSQVGRGILR